MVCDGVRNLNGAHRLISFNGVSNKSRLVSGFHPFDLNLIVVNIRGLGIVRAS